MEVEVEQQHQPLKLKNIRKDVFHYLKAVMEESRIFLPMKLPEEQEILPQPTPQMPEVVHVEVPEVSSSKRQSYVYRVLQTIQLKLILLCV